MQAKMGQIIVMDVARGTNRSSRLNIQNNYGIKKQVIMDYEKKYKEAIKRASNIHKDAVEMENSIITKTCEVIFPELKEPEDERIRACIGMCLTDIDEQRFADFNTNLKECRAWLEKQGEQKPAWSEEDDAMWTEISDLLWEGYKQSGSKFSWDDIRNWVNSKLKSLRPQSTWKPSGEQIKAVKEAACYSSVFSEKTIDNLISLSKDLKKLKG